VHTFCTVSNHNFIPRVNPGRSAGVSRSLSRPLCSQFSYTDMEKSSEIISTARVTVSPEHRRELCLTISALLDLIRHEDGCHTYRFYGEDGDQNSFFLIGEWDSHEAWDRHLDSDNFAVLLGSLKLLSSQAYVDFKLLSHVSDSEATTRARCGPSRESQSAIFIT